MDAFTGLAVTDTAALLDSVRLIISIFVAFAVSIFVAFCWFFIGRKAGVQRSWLAFVPIVGHYVAWRASRTPRWSLALVVISAILVPIAALVLIVSLIAAVAAAFGGYSSGFEVPLIVFSLFVFIVLGVSQFAVLIWWSARAAKTLGFGMWVGLLASPLARLIPFGGQIVRLVFLGILAFRKDPF